jgi:transposase
MTTILGTTRLEAVRPIPGAARQEVETPEPTCRENAFYFQGHFPWLAITRWMAPGKTHACIL